MPSYIAKGDAYLLSNQIDLALVEYKKARLINPYHIDVNKKIADLLIKKRKND